MDQDEDLKNLAPIDEDQDEKDEKEEKDQDEKEEQDEKKEDQDEKEGEASDESSDEGSKEPEDGDSQEVADLRNQVKALEERCQKAEAALERLTKGLSNSKGAAPAAKSFQELIADIPRNATQAEWDDHFLKLKAEHPAEFRNWMKR